VVDVRCRVRDALMCHVWTVGEVSNAHAMIMNGGQMSMKRVSQCVCRDKLGKNEGKAKEGEEKIRICEKKERVQTTTV
jgi:hypothetical protein